LSQLGKRGKCFRLLVKFPFETHLVSIILGVQNPLHSVVSISSPSSAPPSPTCEFFEFTCNDGYCINEGSVCNGIGDCLDKSDEI